MENNKHIMFRLSEDERQLVKGLAKKEGRTVSNYLRWLIQREAERAGNEELAIISNDQ